MAGDASARGWGIASAIALLSACASPSPSCDDLCPVARPAFEECMEQWGLSYGDAVGYSDGDDYDNWCATWVMEQRLLADTADDRDGAHDALEARCGDQIETLSGPDCPAYWGLWD